MTSELGTPLGFGGTAEIYAWPGGQVLKLFHAGFSADVVAAEARIARAVHAAGLPVPAVGELVPFDGRHGLLYERIAGRPMIALLPSKPWRARRYARRLAVLQAQMHAIPAPAGFPPLHSRLQEKIRCATPLAETRRAAALAALDLLPAGDRLGHGDFHPGNVMLTDRGAVIIDWMDATSGNPLADVARTAVIALGAAASDQVPSPLLKLFTRRFVGIYLRQYFQLRPGGEAEYQRWWPIVAAARLSEAIPELETWLLAQAALLP